MKKLLSLVLCVGALFLTSSASFAKAKAKAQKAPAKINKSKALSNAPVNPRTAEDFYKLGLDYEWKNNRLGAAEQYSKALQLNPNLNEARFKRAQIYYFYQKYDRALADYQYFYQHPSFGATSFYENRINSKIALGMYANAMDDMFEVILAYGGQGRVLNMMKQFSDQHPELKYKLNPDTHQDLLIRYSKKAPELRGYAQTYKNDQTPEGQFSYKYFSYLALKMDELVPPTDEDDYTGFRSTVGGEAVDATIK